jgi:hypothetical protein
VFDPYWVHFATAACCPVRAPQDVEGVADNQHRAECAIHSDIAERRIWLRTKTID